MQGILNINKPADWTSHDVVAKLRGILRQRRVGHGGTLDPMATGVLPVFVGRATRAADLMPGEKAYRAEFRIGARTDTGDCTGTVLQTSAFLPAIAQIKTAAQAFRGDIMQTPPMVSAVKIDGQRLYKLARQGKEVFREPRPVRIHKLDIGALDEKTFWLEVVCSKGTYIRALIDDLGLALGCLAHMTALVRLRAGPFCLENAVTLADVTRMAADDTLGACLVPVDVLWPEAAAFRATEGQQKALRNGSFFSTALPEGFYRVYNGEDTFLCLGKVSLREGTCVMTCEKGFFER